MIKRYIASFMKNEDGYVVTYPMDVMIAMGASMMLAYHLTRKVMKIPERWSVFLSLAVTGFVLFLFILWGIRDYYRAEIMLRSVEGVLSIGVLAGMAVYRVAEYIWKIPKSGMIPAWITAICIIVPWLRYVFRYFEQNGDIDVQGKASAHTPENAVTTCESDECDEGHRTC